MHQRLYSFLLEQNIIFESQSWFQKNKSTLHSLIEIVENIRSSMESKKYGCGIFIDLKKAFDTVNHDTLLLKLEHYGIRGNSLNCFKSYLNNRSQFVSINNKCSEINKLTCGVPQGSALRPLLFLIYINDLPNISKKLKFFLFADDTNIYYEDKNTKTIQQVVNTELKKMVEWLNTNRLALNISKTNFVIFSPSNKPKRKVIILLNKKALEEKEYVKYLGVLQDSTLSFRHHISTLNKKISRPIGVMHKIKYFVDEQI